ncbi:MAG: LysM peptidoglycan-binding domain-containing protein [Winogradskyella sp.]|uniref:LysM peptidoglycan-binding domain-containing protein n=1 Tax=Winogradskyella sp. TaxID=1883156 RepID=UPI000F3F44A9|nr:LysM peptidoglycan-binding domain-containing protein [Winogradskyella sp.]RNC86825.1 MAG: LysM peptidoglycan-binding domain-containing protein [Winogradskyella sp.]
MKNVLTAIVFTLTLSLSSQNYKTHKVKVGETIESIAKTYLVTPFDLLALNPDAKNNFGPDTTLIIPNSRVKNDEIVEETKEVIDYKRHKVKRKETLYGLSKKYNVTEDDIKKANPRLYSENLRKGDRIRIPRFKTVISKQSLSNTIKKYVVLPSEGKWRIAYKFGITVQDLMDLNPNMNEVLQPGDELNVPNIANNEEKPTTEDYNYYEVLPKEGFYRLKIKLGLTQEELETLNPELKESGLKAGMVLKLPKEIETDAAILEDSNTTDLRDNITNTSTKHLAMLLPFRLSRIDTDSVAEAKDMIKNDRILSTALDFHSGVLMALDSAKNLGISTNLKVFDTENRISEIANIIDSEDFSDYDAVIGPMMGKTFDRFASTVNGNVPVFAPLAMPSKVSGNVFQTIPNKKILADKMINYVKRDSTITQIFIIADQKHRTVSNDLKKAFPSARQFFSELVKSKGKDNGKDAYFIYPTRFENVFKKGKNVVFLETDDVSFGSSIISLLNGLAIEDIEIILTTTDKSKAFESKDPDNNYHLSNLKFHYPTVNKQYDTSLNNNFVTDYKRKYGVTPSKYATRGYDLTLDILLRLASSEDGLSNMDTETQYVENKFRYNKKLFGGYINEASYIVKFDNLNIVEVD